MSEKSKRNWKPVPIDASSFSANDFDFFGGIEELTDYEVIRPNKKRKLVENTRTCHKNKKIQKGVGDDKVNKESGQDDTVQSQNLMEDLDMSAWCNLFVPDEILNALKDLGFKKPTEIQELALPVGIRDHRDILVAAETGSGKTLAFGIPVIAHIKARKELQVNKDIKDENELKGLVLAPTRELALQVKNHLQSVSKYVDVKIVAVVGGMSLEKQKRLLRKSPDIIVATPGRLWQLMEEGEPYLEQIPYVRYLVIDEADRMVEQGHFEELRKILELLKEDRGVRRQTFVFSATLTMVHELPKRFELKKKKKVVSINKLESLMQVIGVKEKAKVIDITKKSGVVETLTESQLFCSLEEKDIYLYYFKVMYPGRTLVFCNSISSVRRLKSVFEQLGCAPLTLHASMQQRQRLKSLEKFTSSEHGLLLSTDVAARGLDIKGIEHVVHFQIPRTAEIYIHRSGRTARAQSEGLSLMLIEPQEGVFYKRICKALNKDRSLPSFPIDQGVLKVVKERVFHARQIDQLQHRQQRMAAENRWFLKAAEDMEVDLEDENLLTDLGDQYEQSVRSQKLKSMKKQLQIMLKKKIVPTAFTGSYPTKMGKLLEPVEIGVKSAVMDLKDSSNVSVLRRKKQKKKKYK